MQIRRLQRQQRSADTAPCDVSRPGSRHVLAPGSVRFVSFVLFLFCIESFCCLHLCFTRTIGKHRGRDGGRGGYSLATQQGIMVFAPRSLEQGAQIRAFLSRTGYTFCHTGRGYYFAARIALQTNVAVFPARVRRHVYSNTPFPIRRSTASVWNGVAKLCLFSLEKGQLPKHSAEIDGSDPPEANTNRTFS